MSHQIRTPLTLISDPIRHIVERVLAWSLPQGVCLNVNAPVGEIKGIKVCRQAPGLWSNEFMKTLTPFDKHCFWLTGSFSNEEPGAVDTDEWALGEGFISVQPVQTDLTDYNLLNEYVRHLLQVLLHTLH